MNIEFAKTDLNDDQKSNIEVTRHLFNELLENIKPYMGEGRYLSVVKTKLEEACFLLIKAFV
jgi:hypothetical protein